MKEGFNFLKPQVEAPSIWTSLYAWIVNTARVILIITETAVILALVFRIIVDVQGKDLDAKIKTYESMLELRLPEEKKYLNLQGKTNTYQTAFNSLPLYNKIVSEINTNIPKEFIKVNILFQKDTITITGESQNTYIQKMEEYLKGSDFFSESKLETLTIEESQSEKISKFNFTSRIKNPELRQLITDNE